MVALPGPSPDLKVSPMCPVHSVTYVTGRTQMEHGA